MYQFIVEIIVIHLLTGRCEVVDRDITVQELPRTLQSSKRIIIANTISGERPDHVLVRQLYSYVHICEAGYEVHVVLVTHTSWFDRFKLLYVPSMFECARTRSDLAIAVSKWQEDGKLAARHRSIFDKLINNYDLYASHEDDILLQAWHVSYFDKWSAHFGSESRLHPGFLMYEIRNRNLTSNRKPTSKYTPHVISTHSSIILHLFQQDNQMLIIQDMAWAPMYMLTNKLLNMFVLKEWWSSDINATFQEFNPYFQQLWLAPHKRLVIPVNDYPSSLIHHTSNKYAYVFNQGKPVHETNKTLVGRIGNIEEQEYVAFITKCLGTYYSLGSTSKEQHSNINISHVYFINNLTCQSCFESGQAVRITPLHHILSPYYHDSNVKNESFASLSCVDKTKMLDRPQHHWVRKNGKNGKKL